MGARKSLADSGIPTIQACSAQPGATLLRPEGLFQAGKQASRDPLSHSAGFFDACWDRFYTDSGIFATPEKGLNFTIYRGPINPTSGSWRQGGVPVSYQLIVRTIRQDPPGYRDYLVHYDLLRLAADNSPHSLFFVAISGRSSIR